MWAFELVGRDKGGEKERKKNKCVDTLWTYLCFLFYSASSSLWEKKKIKINIETLHIQSYSFICSRFPLILSPQMANRAWHGEIEQLRGWKEKYSFFTWCLKDTFITFYCPLMLVWGISTVQQYSSTIHVAVNKLLNQSVFFNNIQRSCSLWQ